MSIILSLETSCDESAAALVSNGKGKFQLLANENQDSKVTTNIAEQLKTLQDLYKSGILSGYEYEKEKKKILNK